MIIYFGVDEVEAVAAGLDTCAIEQRTTIRVVNITAIATIERLCILCIAYCLQVFEFHPVMLKWAKMFHVQLIAQSPYSSNPAQ